MVNQEAARTRALDLLDFIDNSPSPWHAVASIEQRLVAHSFKKLDESSSWQLEPGGRYYVIRDDSSIICFIVGGGHSPDTAFNIVGAHTDSPGLRVKPLAAHTSDGFLRLGVEVYGGPILATFADRDLSLAGRVVSRDKEGLKTSLVHFEQPLLRLPNLAIHMNRTVNEEGLKFNKQTELPLLLTTIKEQLDGDNVFLNMLADNAKLNADDIISWELNVFDTQKGALYGPEQEFIADSQLDNLASCHAALSALLESADTASENTRVCALFDHEEVGSESHKGADGSFMSDTLERISIALAANGEAYKRALSKSFIISCDMAHAWQPNFPQAYEPQHRVQVNSGPVIKLNANQRYSSESVSEATFIHLCEKAGVPWQKYSHRTDIPCGSTIGPMSSARLGVRSVDVGNPMWAMHSIRESAGVLDHEMMIQVLKQFFSP